MLCSEAFMAALRAPRRPFGSVSMTIVTLLVHRSNLQFERFVCVCVCVDVVVELPAQDAESHVVYHVLPYSRQKV